MQRDELIFDVLRSALYHTSRHQHFARAHRWIMFLVIALGTAGVSNYLSEWLSATAIGGLTAVLAAVDLVLDWRSKSEKHNSLRNKYYVLLAKLEKHPEAQPAQLCDWKSEHLLLVAEAPGEFRAVDALAFNEAVDALARDEDHKLLVPWYAKLFAQLVPFRGRSFAYVKSRSA